MLDLDRELGGLAERDLVSPLSVEVIKERAARRRRGRRRASAAAGSLILVLGTVFAAVVLRTHDSPEATITTSPRDALGALPAGWHLLGTIPKGTIVPDNAAWTGTDLVLWDATTGLAYNPITEQWRRLPRSPLSRRALVTMVWTGREVLVWGGTKGFTDTTGATPYTDGAAYNPRTNRWRRIPSAPIKPRLTQGIWTGHELIVSGGPPNTVGRAQSIGQVLTDGAAYDPTANTWRHIPPAPIPVTQGVVTWTGSQMLVYGSFRSDFLDANGTISESQAALFDPGTNHWRALPNPGVTGVDPAATVAGHKIVAVGGYATTPRALDLTTATWKATTGFNATPQEACSPTLSGSPTVALLSSCGDFWTFNPATDEWAHVASPSVPFDQQPWGQPIWTGHAFLFWDTNPWTVGTVPTSNAAAKDLDVWAYVPPSVKH